MKVVDPLGVRHVAQKAAVTVHKGVGTIIGSKDGFQDTPIVSGKGPVTFAVTSAIVFMIASLVFAILTSYGAARLSYCYNKYTGATDTMALFFAVLCFFFSFLYYPYYAVFLSPLCSLNKNGASMSGGRRRMW